MSGGSKMVESLDLYGWSDSICSNDGGDTLRVKNQQEAIKDNMFK